MSCKLWNCYYSTPVVQPWCKKGKEKCKCLKIKHLHSVRVPRAGIEPARIAPLVFETSASTDSAIWAWCLGSFGLLLTVTEVVDLLVEGCKGMLKFGNMQ